MKKILQIKNVTKYYKDVMGVENISFDLNEGEIFGIIGSNGAGKSTTIRTIMNLINKTSGEVLFQGKNLDKDSIELKQEIGYLPSEISLYEDLTIKEMLQYHQSFYKKDFSNRKNELIEMLKIDENKKISDLSLGNQKKLGIVLAFMHEPKLLILDEPTNGLDPMMQQVFYELLKQENKKGTTILYSTHILSEIEKNCDRVCILKDGHILKIETIKKLQEKKLKFITITSKDVKKIINEIKCEILLEEENKIRFKNTIEINELIKILSKYEISNLLIEEPTLEELFLHYYE